MSAHVVAAVGDLADGERRLVEVEGREIGVFNVDGEYYAYPNTCPHQQGPVCEGALTGIQEVEFDRDSLDTAVEWSDDDRVLVCPWHSWMFDVRTGEALPQRDLALPSYETRVEDGQIVIEV